MTILMVCQYQVVHTTNKQTKKLLYIATTGWLRDQTIIFIEHWNVLLNRAEYKENFIHGIQQQNLSFFNNYFGWIS